MLKKAHGYVERALSIDPESPDAHRAAAGILLLKSRFEEAKAADPRDSQLAHS